MSYPIFVAASTPVMGTASTALVANKPSGTLQGHAIIVNIGYNDSVITITPPTGFSRIPSTPPVQATNLQDVCYIKIAGSSEPTTYTFTASANVRYTVNAATYSNVDPTNPIGVVNTNSAAAATPINYPTLAANSNDGIVIFTGGTRNTTGTVTVSNAGTGQTVRSDSCVTTSAYIEGFIVEGATVAAGSTPTVNAGTSSRSVQHALVSFVLQGPISTNVAPTVSLNTSSGSTFLNGNPSLAFTGTDTDGDAITYELQVDTLSTFNSVSGAPLLDKISGSVSGSTQSFNTSGSWVCPAGVTSILVEVWGAGGGGATYSGTIGAGGGGGGGYSASTIPVTPGTSYPYVVGTSTPASGTNTAGNTGGQSYFIDVSTVMANGGGGGANNTTSLGGSGAAAGVGTTTYTGGSGGNGSTGETGAGGGSGSASGNGGNAFRTTAGTSGAGGGAGVTNGAGNAPGGGSSARGAGSSTGYAGGTGRVTITTTSVAAVGFTDITDGTDTDPFDSGDQISYMVQLGDTLSNGTYYWRVRGRDPSGSNTYGAWSSTNNFIISNYVPPNQFFALL